MLHLLISASLATLCIRNGYLKRWKEYYPTILFFIVGDLAYNFILYKYSLWEYNFPLFPDLGHTLIDLYWAIIIFPCIVILFLTFYPKQRIKQPIYILLWSAAFSLLEYIMFLSGSIVYDNGWCGFFSFLFDLVMFPILYVHYKKPPAAWIITAVIVPVFLLVVGMPLDGIK